MGLANGPFIKSQVMNAHGARKFIFSRTDACRNKVSASVDARFKNTMIRLDDTSSVRLDFNCLSMDI